MKRPGIKRSRSRAAPLKWPSPLTEAELSGAVFHLTPQCITTLPRGSIQRPTLSDRFASWVRSCGAKLMNFRRKPGV